MIMTPEEQHDMLKLINEAKEIQQKKTDMMEELLYTCAALAQENEMLKQQLKIAEKTILRLTITDIES